MMLTSKGLSEESVKSHARNRLRQYSQVKMGSDLGIIPYLQNRNLTVISQQNFKIPGLSNCCFPSPYLFTYLCMYVLAIDRN